MEYDNFEHNMLALLKLFSDRPNHLIKYLIENNGLTDEFKDIISKSDNLNNITPLTEQVDFLNHSEMHLYYSKLVDDNIDDINKTHLELLEDLNSKLFDLLKSEQYEYAAKLRDYMLKKNIKIII